MLGKFGKDNPNSKPVDMLALDGTYIKTFDSSLSASIELGVYRESICRCCNGKQKTTGGYKWRYTKTYEGD